MKNELTIIGGTYFEHCEEPLYFELFGSGLRAAAALSSRRTKINFVSCIGKKDLQTVKSICNTYGFKHSFKPLKKTVNFHYYHPLSIPAIENLESLKSRSNKVIAQNILCYGLIEQDFRISGNYVVYDPQNHLSFKDSGSKAKHLALVLNHREARMISTLSDTASFREIGLHLIKSQKAEVVVIKAGPRGAIVIDGTKIFEVPIFETKSVWPIGSGDIFSAVFAFNWIIKRNSAYESAYSASIFTAQYCQSPTLPLPLKPETFVALPKINGIRSIYLAGPFFTISERWLINELRNALHSLGNQVFSPFHDVGLLDSDDLIKDSKTITSKDLAAIENCDVMLAVLSGSDPGTIFEIGYARHIKKKVIILSENTNKSDLTLFIGSECEITSDLSTAVYKASW